MAAHRVLEPGWHHLVGVYDGHRIMLYVDGMLAAERDADGDFISSRLPATCGCLSGGSVAFSGRIEVVRIAAAARSAGWIATAHADIANGTDFVQLAPE